MADSRHRRLLPRYRRLLPDPGGPVVAFGSSGMAPKICGSPEVSGRLLGHINRLLSGTFCATMANGQQYAQ